MLKKLQRKAINWSMTTSLLSSPRNIAKQAMLESIQREKGPFLFINQYFDSKATYNPELLKINALVKKVKRETRMLLRDVEAYQLYNAVKQTAKIDGEIAEVGVFKGGSAKLICEAKGNKQLHLFDTFDGLPAPSGEDDKGQFQANQFSAAYDEVVKYLQDYPNAYFYKGLFPSTAGSVTDTKFSFVHFDVDLYDATVECLKFFYPRMNKGGIMLSHDYGYAIGVRRAFDEFFSDKPEPVIEPELIGTQCLVVKT